MHYGEPLSPDLDIGAAYENFRTGEVTEPIKAREVLGGPFAPSECGDSGNQRILSVKRVSIAIKSDRKLP